MTTTNSQSTTEPTSRSSAKSWRVVDIVVAAVLGVAVGIIFVGWNYVGGAGYEVFNAVTPGLGGLVVGIWLMGGVLGGLVIRKPGAALMVELIAAIVSALVGNVWGITTLYSGIAQGLGAELVFLLFAYRRWGAVPAMLAGAGAGVGAWLLELVMGNLAKGATYNAIYLVALLISGAVLAGLVGWALTKALAGTGALSRFESGRSARAEV
ncbi:MAG TPA: ECF transporter S component [Propionibacteriaceae bacterium]|nr:ECF transporter S component [Propionibacteriaceae bacterium]